MNSRGWIPDTMAAAEGERPCAAAQVRTFSASDRRCRHGSAHWLAAGLCLFAGIACGTADNRARDWTEDGLAEGASSQSPRTGTRAANPGVTDVVSGQAATAEGETEARGGYARASGGRPEDPSGEDGMPEIDAFPLLGYANLGQGTTGGQGDPSPVTVSSSAALQEAISQKGPGPLTIFVRGRLSPSSGPIALTGASDISILGLGNDAELDGLALNLVGASNVIVRNLNIHHVPADQGGAIRIANGSHHIWIDHCSLHSDLDHGAEFYDSLIAIIRASDFITISWNHIYTHFNALLVGHDDANGAEDAGTFHITYHHNLLEHLSTQLPSVRFGQVHLFDNHYVDVTNEGGRSGVAVSVRMTACGRLEHNRFDEVTTPVVVNQSLLPGAVQLIDNDFNGATPAAADLVSCVLDPPYGYVSELESAAGLAETLRNRVGAGVLSAPNIWTTL